MSDAQLMQGDCLVLMQDIPDSSVDMVLCDPPYCSGGLFAANRQASTKTKYTDASYNGASRFPSFSGDNMDQRSFTEFMRMVLAMARQKTKPEGIVGVFMDWRNLPALTDAIQMAGWVWRGIVVWDKGSARNIPGRFRADCEYIVWGTNGPKAVDWTPGFSVLPGLYRVPSVASKNKHHQTEKPVALIEELLKIIPEGLTILDPFMGSGSTGVACINTGRNFIGIEMDKYYFEVAKQRIEEVKQRGKIRDE